MTKQSCWEATPEKVTTLSTPVRCVDISGEVIDFKTQAEAAKYYGIKRTTMAGAVMRSKAKGEAVATQCIVVLAL